MFTVFREPGSDWVVGVDTRQQPLWDEHAAFMDVLFDEGRVVLAGPFVDGQGAALVVMDASDEDEIRSRFGDDPWCREQDILRVGEIREWRIFLDARDRG